MNALTLAELRLKQAEYAHRAERLSQTWRTLPTGAKSTAMGKQVKLLKERAEDYAHLLRRIKHDEMLAVSMKVGGEAP